MSSPARVHAIQRLVCTLADRVYRSLGWGWREEIYREALALELQGAGLECRCEVASPVLYKGRPLSHVSVRLDLVVGGCVAVELKAVSSRMPAKAIRQCERYIATVSDLVAGVVLNFPDAPKRMLERVIIPAAARMGAS